MKDEVRAFQKNMVELVIFSDGAISYNDAWMLSTDEREMFYDTVKTKMEAKSGKKKEEML